VGQILIIVLLASLTYAIIEGPGSGWASAKILFFFGLAVAALITFLAWEPRRDDPLVAACGAIVLILGIITTGRWARRTAARTATLLESVPPSESRIAVPVSPR